jgi:peptidyl-prolyl cis-trans isomerase SurA
VLEIERLVWLWTAAAIFFAPRQLARAEVIDRIAVTVGKQIIAESQVTEEIRVTAFLDGKAPDWSKDNRAKTVNRLVDQTLIRREIDATRFPEAPPEEGAKLLEQLKAGMKDFSTSLAALHLSEAVVQRHLQWQVTFLRFVEFRFKPGVEVSDADLKDFYATQVKEWKQQGKPVPEFDEVRGDLERLLTSKYVDQALDRWLGDQRTQTAIVFKGDKKIQP